MLNHLSSPAELVRFWQKFGQTLATLEIPGCPKTGHYNNAVQKVLDARLTQLPPPSDKQALGRVADFLETRADAIWLKYQIAAIGLPGLKERLAADLGKSLASGRTPQSCALLSGRIALTGGTITNKPELQAWANVMLAIIGDQTLYTSGTGKAAREYADPCTVTLRTLAGNSPDARAEFERDLKKAVEGSRTPATCDLMVKRLDAITREIKNPNERAAWGNALLDLIAGHETYAPPNDPTRIALDPLVNKIHALGCDLTISKSVFEADLKASIAGTRTPESTYILSLRLKALIQGIRDPKAQKAWAEKLLPMIAGKESYEVTLPDKQGTKQVWTEDHCAPPIYQPLGQKSPAQTKAEEAKRAAAVAKAKAAAAAKAAKAEEAKRAAAVKAVDDAKAAEAAKAKSE